MKTTMAFMKRLKTIAKTIFKFIMTITGFTFTVTTAVGKHHLSACIDLMEKDIQVIFTSLGSIIRETFSNNLIYERLARVPFLFLDDLGKEFMGRENDAQKAKVCRNSFKECFRC